MPPSPRRKLGGRDVRRVEDEQVDAAVPQRRHEVALHGAQERGARRVPVRGDGAADRLGRRDAGVRVQVHGARHHGARPEERRRVRGQEGDDDAGARADLDHQGWPRRRPRGGGARGGRRGRRGPETGLEKGCFRGRGEDVEEEKGVFGWFVDTLVGHVRGIWGWQHSGPM